MGTNLNLTPTSTAMLSFLSALSPEALAILLAPHCHDSPPFPGVPFRADINGDEAWDIGGGNDTKVYRRAGRIVIWDRYRVPERRERLEKALLSMRDVHDIRFD